MLDRGLIIESACWCFTALKLLQLHCLVRMGSSTAAIQTPNRSQPALILPGHGHAELLAGLKLSPKFIPDMYLYDEAGSEIFERVRPCCWRTDWEASKLQIADIQ